MEKTAIIIVDMLKDNVDTDSHFKMGEEARKIIPPIQRLLAFAREKGMPVIFANDSFLPDDFIFREGKGKPHSIIGTEGAKVIAEFGPEDSDIILPKRRFSAFWGTNLESMLREKEIDTIAVCGISTSVCVLASVLDGIAHDFRVLLMDDCCATFKPEHHTAVVNMYCSGALYPLLQAMSLDDFLSAAEAGKYC
ncbi:MAG: isochorismatase family cysteine hydrolase [Chloroflexota bacterium]|nr:isochorismatase family cysteine hydrolase [Chloroflexota bacterium]